jgi:hypothetical protein
MSVHLLKQLLDLNTQSDKPNTKYVQYYSTDKGRNVVREVPVHMKIVHNFPSSSSITHPSDDSSDVSSRLLNKVIKNQETKPMTFYSTDTDSYVTKMVPEKIKPIKNVQDLTSFSQRFPSIYSDIYISDNDTNDIISSKSNNYDISSNSNIYSDDFSKKSSFLSNETSYDSFYDDILDEYKPKERTFSELVSKYDLEDLTESPRKSTASSFNIFKSKHRGE